MFSNQSIKLLSKVRTVFGSSSTSRLITGRRNFHTISLNKFALNTFLREKENNDHHNEQLASILKQSKSKGGASLNKKELNFFIKLKLNTHDLRKLQSDFEKCEFQQAVENFNKEIVEKSKLLEERNGDVDMTRFSFKLGEFVRRQNTKKKKSTEEYFIKFENYEKWDKKKTLLVMRTPTERKGAGLSGKEIAFLNQFKFNGKALHSIVQRLKMKTRGFEQDLFNFMSKARIKPEKATITNILCWAETHLIESFHFEPQSTGGGSSSKKEVDPKEPTRKDIENKRSENVRVLEEQEAELAELEELFDHSDLVDELSELKEMIKKKGELISELREELKELGDELKEIIEIENDFENGFEIEFEMEMETDGGLSEIDLDFSFDFEFNIFDVLD